MYGLFAWNENQKFQFVLMYFDNYYSMSVPNMRTWHLNFTHVGNWDLSFYYKYETSDS